MEAARIEAAEVAFRLETERIEAAKVAMFSKRPQQPVEDDIECWDDDNDLQGIENLQLRAASTTALPPITSTQSSHHRDPISSTNQISRHGDSVPWWDREDSISRISTMSDIDSNYPPSHHRDPISSTKQISRHGDSASFLDREDSISRISTMSDTDSTYPTITPTQSSYHHNPISSTKQISRHGDSASRSYREDSISSHISTLPDTDIFPYAGDSASWLFREESLSSQISIRSDTDTITHHRDSASFLDREDSISLISTIDWNDGGDENFQVVLPTDDEVSTTTAIASAKSAGIPIPANVPSSALLGGTIKRLGGRAIKKVLGGDDWDEDLELPKVEEGGLTLKKTDATDFPDVLRQSAQPLKPVVAALDKFRDEEGDDEFFGDIATIKVPKSRPTPDIINFIPPPTKAAKGADNFEDDLELPSDGEPLKLSNKKENVKTPVLQSQEEVDTEWAEGSIGTRFGGTKRDGTSNRSSSVTALSPSVSSCLTAESEDDGLNCLILPDGPLQLEEALKKRTEKATSDVVGPPSEKQVEKPTAPKEDFFAGIDIGDGDVFESGKLTLNRNVKHIAARQKSPPRRTAMTLTFTNKAQSTTTATRIPKPQGHDRLRSKLEPVSEVGGSLRSYQRPQLLKSKCSLPVLTRQTIPSRPKIAVDRVGAGSSIANTRKPLVPFLPAGMSLAQSHHISTRNAREQLRRRGSSGSSEQLRRRGSSDSNEHAPLNSRPISRNSNITRPSSRANSRGRANSGGRATSRKDIAPESLAREAASKRHITKPTRRRAFGDGSELEIFDDLPTSATIESKFVKQPIGRGAPKSTLRNRFGHVQIPAPSRTETPAPRSPTKQNFIPHFARDTNASRIAREQRTGAVNAHPLREAAGITHLAPLREGTATNIHPPREVGGPLVPLSSTNTKSAIAARGPLPTPSLARTKPRKHAHHPPQKPCLIKPLGDHVTSAKSLNGMHWNSALFRWEGNETALAPFDAPVSAAQVSPTSSPGIKPAPALIANVGATKAVQVVGDMVFDPQRMCWLKMGPGHGSNTKSPDSVEEEEDPFAGLEDLVERMSIAVGGFDAEAGNGKKVFGGDDQWLVGEEFDVGPEFVRRQRTEEEKWTKKVVHWTVPGRDGGDDWKWEIRRIVGCKD